MHQVTTALVALLSLPLALPNNVSHSNGEKVARPLSVASVARAPATAAHSPAPLPDNRGAYLVGTATVERSPSAVRSRGKP